MELGRPQTSSEGDEVFTRNKIGWAYTKAQMQSIRPDVYVPEEVLHVFDKTRERLRLESPDLSSEVIYEIFDNCVQ